jgi:single-strand DNA-binding protein
MVLWRQMADFATTYMTKGRLVYVEGRLQGRIWEAADGTQRRAVEVVADRFQALSAKTATEVAA